MASNITPPDHDRTRNNQQNPRAVDPGIETIQFESAVTMRSAQRHPKLPFVGLGSRSAAYSEVDSSGSTTELVETDSDPTYMRHILLAIVSLIIAFPFGVLALMLAASARSNRKSVHEDLKRSARKEARISMILSIAGIVVFIIAVVIAVSVTASTSASGLATFDDVTTENTVTASSTSTTPRPAPVITISKAPCLFFSYHGFCFEYRLQWDQIISATTTATTISVANATSVDGGMKSTTAVYTPPPVAPKLTPRRCRSGVPDSADPSSCYYNARFNASDGLSCHADFNATDGFCYHTSYAACELASNYRNGFCFTHARSVASEADCRHGSYADGECYYDGVFATTDSSCRGFKADRGIGDNDDGYCYYSSPASCSKAANFVRGECYDYVLWGSNFRRQTDCNNGGVYEHGNCYFKKAVLRTGTDCSPTWFSHGVYCYSNS